MWLSEINILGNNLTKYKIRQNNTIITFQNAIELLKNDNEFILFFNELLRTSPCEAYFWEVKPVNINALQDEFEFVLVNSSTLLKIKADSSAFAKHFTGNKYTTSFSNLGGDSKLIVPVGITEAENYSHIAKFVRNAPQEQIIAFWNLVGNEYSKAMSHDTKWLSTSGLGIHWLHVRIDSYPKYYNYQPYREYYH